MGKKSLRQVLAQNVEQRMKASGLDSNPKLEAASGIGHAHLSRLRTCTSAMTIDKLEQLAAAFKCQAWELLIDDEEMRREIIARYIR